MRYINDSIEKVILEEDQEMSLYNIQMEQCHAEIAVLESMIKKCIKQEIILECADANDIKDFSIFCEADEPASDKKKDTPPNPLAPTVQYYDQQGNYKGPVRQEKEGFIKHWLNKIIDFFKMVWDKIKAIFHKTTIDDLKNMVANCSDGTIFTMKTSELYELQYLSKASKLFCEFITALQDNASYEKLNKLRDRINAIIISYDNVNDDAVAYDKANKKAPAISSLNKAGMIKFLGNIEDAKNSAKSINELYAVINKTGNLSESTMKYISAYPEVTTNIEDIMTFINKGSSSLLKLQKSIIKKGIKKSSEKKID